jgi:hypothetical protein
VADIAELAVRPLMVNVKPSRFGTLKALLEAYDYLTAEGIGAYGGGQFELGPGRGQIQYLASLFHPDAPNDVAPTGYHEVQPGLPTSPLDVATAATGFTWGSTCCSPAQQASCCDPAAKAECCAPSRSEGCGCR